MYLENLFIYLKKLKKHYILFTISWSRTFQKNCLRTVFFFFAFVLYRFTKQNDAVLSATGV